MTEINVNAILDQDCSLLSASAFELGPCAADITWRNCLALAERHPLVTDENRQDVRDHFRAYGAWDADEIAAWTDVELSAMVWQEAAADVRHFEDHCESSLARYQADCEERRCSGRLYFPSANADGQPTSALIYLGI